MKVQLKCARRLKVKQISARKQHEDEERTKLCF